MVMLKPEEFHATKMEGIMTVAAGSCTTGEVVVLRCVSLYSWL